MLGLLLLGTPFPLGVPLGACLDSAEKPMVLLASELWRRRREEVVFVVAMVERGGDE